MHLLELRQRAARHDARQGGLEALFAPHIFSAKDLGPDRVKPKPDIFLHGAKQMGVSPDRAVVAEDSVHGIHAARLRACASSALPAPRTPIPTHADKLTDAGAETVISRMSDLPGVVAALAEWEGVCNSACSRAHGAALGPYPKPGLEADR